MADAAEAEKKREKNATSVRRGRRLVVVAAVLAILFLACEFSLRWTMGLGRPLLYERDAACGYIPLPNQFVCRFGCLNEINSFSMRAPAVQTPKPEGEYRLLFVGDSVTYGTTHVDQSRIFTSILNDALPVLLHRKVEVLNASTGGWAVGNELGYLESRGTFSADVVVFVINTGDLTQGFAENDMSLAGGYPDHRPISAIGELWERYLAPRIFNRSTGDSGTQAVTDNNAAKKAEAEVLAQLKQAKSLAQAAGARFAIVYSPFAAASFQTEESRREFEVFKSWAGKNHVPVLDLTPFDAQSAVDEVFMDGMHLMPLGHHIAAQALLKWQPIMPMPGS